MFLFLINILEKKLLKIDKRDVPNKSVMDGKMSRNQINVQHVY